MLKVLEHILMTWPALEPEYRAFNEAVRDLQGDNMVELQRLAAEMPDHLLVSVSHLYRPGRLIHLSRTSTIKFPHVLTKSFLLVLWMRKGPSLIEAFCLSLCEMSSCLVRLGHF